MKQKGAPEEPVPSEQSTAQIKGSEKLERPSGRGWRKTV